MSYFDKPQQVRTRKIIFQIHVWTGLILGLYMLLIGTSGSILVFDHDLARISSLRTPPIGRIKGAVSETNVAATLRAVQKIFPKDEVSGITLSTSSEPLTKVFLRTKAGEMFSVSINPHTGAMTRSGEPPWLLWTFHLHRDLLAGNIGLLVNGIGACFLLILCISGIVVWWPGVKHWRYALSIRFKGSWKRINWDIHRAVGFWTLALLSMWAISGIYFVWSKQCSDLINRFSSISATLPPHFVVPVRAKSPWPVLDVMLTQAKLSSPESILSGINFPSNSTSPLTVYMARGERGDFNHMDYVYLDPSTGKQLAIWHRGVNPTFGSKLVFWLVPLHFGIDWGLPIKIIWACCGLGLPTLFITGTLMYWNRSLSKQWRLLKGNSMIDRKMHDLDRTSRIESRQLVD